MFKRALLLISISIHFCPLSARATQKIIVEDPFDERLSSASEVFLGKLISIENTPADVVIDEFNDQPRTCIKSVKMRVLKSWKGPHTSGEISFFACSPSPGPFSSNSQLLRRQSGPFVRVPEALMFLRVIDGKLISEFKYGFKNFLNGEDPANSSDIKKLDAIRTPSR